MHELARPAGATLNAVVEGGDDFFGALNWFEPSLHAIEVLESQLAGELSEGERKWWCGRREFYEQRLLLNAGELLNTTYRLLAAAGQAGWRARGLDALARRLAGCLRDRTVPWPPPELIERAREDCDRLDHRARVSLETWASDLAVHDDDRAGEHARARRDVVEGSRLSQRLRDLLEAVHELEMLDPHGRFTASDIALKAEGVTAGPELIKRPLAALVAQGLLQSHKGRGGGYWLTPAGRAVAELARQGP